MKDQEWLKLNSEGFFPGPEETEETFLKRVEALKTQKRLRPGDLDWKETFSKLNKLFDFSPLHLSAFYSNQSLMPWEGAATWIHANQIASIQLKKKFQKGSFLGYSREDILAHEAVHAFRSGFQEPQFEEHFAYMVFDQSWKQYLGPILQRPQEIWPLLCMLPILFLYPSCVFLALGYLFLGFLRLQRNHLILKKARAQIAAEIKDKNKILPLLLRLKDKEIQRLSKGICIKKACENPQTLRWKIIELAYLM